MMKITANQLSLQIIQMGKIGGLILIKCHNKELHNLAMLEEVLTGI
jgi:hypothetical protein